MCAMVCINTYPLLLGNRVQEIACVFEEDFSPKPFSKLIWAVTLYKEPINVITGNEYH